MRVNHVNSVSTFNVPQVSKRKKLDMLISTVTVLKCLIIFGSQTIHSKVVLLTNLSEDFSSLSPVHHEVLVLEPKPTYSQKMTVIDFDQL